MRGLNTDASHAVPNSIILSHTDASHAVPNSIILSHAVPNSIILSAGIETFHLHFAVQSTVVPVQHGVKAACQRDAGMWIDCKRTV